MYSRIFSLASCAALAACGTADKGENKVAAAPAEDRIECATGGAADFTRNCAIERSADGARWTIRHADGGFRVLDVTPDLAVSPADGAGELIGKALPDGRLEVTAGQDRYRLPPK